MSIFLSGGLHNVVYFIYTKYYVVRITLRVQVPFLSTSYYLVLLAQILNRKEMK